MSLSAVPVNKVGSLVCNQLAFLYDGSGNVNAAYLNAGDYTPIIINATGGTPGAVYTVVAGVSASVNLAAGTLSAGNVVGISAYYNPTKPGWPNYTKYSTYTAS